MTVSIQIDIDFLSLNAAASVKRCRVLFSIRRVRQSTNLYMKPHGLFDRLLFVDPMLCSDPIPMMLEVTALIFSAIYFGATAYITLVEHPARLACSPEVALVQCVKSTPRYAASALIAAAAALVHSKAGTRVALDMGKYFAPRRFTISSRRAFADTTATCRSELSA